MDGDAERLEIRDGQGRMRFNESAAKYVLSVTGHEDMIAAIQRDLRVRHDRASLSLEMVRQHLPHLPVLGVAKLFYIHTLAMDDCFKRPTKLKPYQTYVNWRAEEQSDLPPDEPCGLVFTWPAVARFMCLHNVPHAVADDDYRFVFGVRGQVYILEPLEHLLALYTSGRR